MGVVHLAPGTTSACSEHVQVRRDWLGRMLMDTRTTLYLALLVAVLLLIFSLPASDEVVVSEDMQVLGHCRWDD